MSARASAITSGSGDTRREERRPSGDDAGWLLAWTCTSSGRTRWATERASEACLTASAASSAWSEPACSTVEETRDVGERRAQVEVLERAAAEHLGRHLARHRDDRGPVDLRVVQPGEQVGRAGPGDAEACGGPTGELAVRGCREGGGALVADADVLQPARLLEAPEGVGEPQVRVADHAEHRVDAPAR